MEKAFCDLELLVPTASTLVDKEIRKMIPQELAAKFGKLEEDYLNGVIDEDEYRLGVQEYDSFRDRVLEEVDEAYKGKIDYERIYSKENVDYGFLEEFNSVSQNMEGYIVFFYNTDCELEAKTKLCSEVAKNCKVISIKFYNEQYTPNRNISKTSKAQYIMKLFGLSSLRGCRLYDICRENCMEWNAADGVSELRTPSTIADEQKVLSK